MEPTPKKKPLPTMREAGYVTQVSVNGKPVPKIPADPFFGAPPPPSGTLEMMNHGDAQAGKDLGELRNFLVRHPGGKFLTPMSTRQVNEIVAGGDRSGLPEEIEGDISFTDKGHNPSNDAELAANAQAAKQRMAQAPGVNGGLFDGIRRIATQLAGSPEAPSAASQAGGLAGSEDEAKKKEIQEAIAKMMASQPGWDRTN